MFSPASPWRRFVLLLGALIAVGCGGGGGGAAAVTPTPAAGNDPALPSVDVGAVAARDAGSPLAADWQRGAFAQIFVRSYQDKDGDGIGDLRGLIDRLDYLRDLGITGLWLMPVFTSQDKDHGYAVSDYRAIEPQYGTAADFDELLRQAHARGIGVIVDYVMNHSAAQNPAFVNARAAASNSFRDWYVWRQLAPSGWSIYGGNPWRSSATGSYFAPFWDQMPDFNLTNPAVVAWHADNLRFWLNRGVDGFRFDAVGNLVENGASQWENQPQNYNLMRDVRGLMNNYAQRYLVCEAPADPNGFHAACGSAFAFGQQSRMIGAARGNEADIQAVANYFRSAPAGVATFLSNHDSFAGDRLWNQLGGNQAQYRLAAATYLLHPGTPFIYYGEEIGMARATGLSGDPGLRTPMSWTNDGRTAGFSSANPYRALSANVGAQNVQAQAADPASLLNFYKAMLALRKSSAALRTGSYDNAVASGQTLSFQRRQGNERVLVVINYGTATITAALQNLPAGAALASAFPAGGDALAADAHGAASLLLPAQSVRVFRAP